jgi:hypothetical protein
VRLWLSRSPRHLLRTKLIVILEKEWSKGGKGGEGWGLVKKRVRRGLHRRMESFGVWGPEPLVFPEPRGEFTLPYTLVLPVQLIPFNKNGN